MKPTFYALIILSLLSACIKKELPVACFDFTPIDSVNGGIQFTNCSENAVDYFWDFGNGAISKEISPMKEFELDFPLQISLVARNEYGTDTLAIVISESDFNIAPKALFSWELDTSGKLRVNFKNQSINAIGFSWNFSDGTTSTEANPSHQFKQPGIYSVSLKAEMGNKSTETLHNVEVIDSFNVASSFYVKINENNARQVHFFNTSTNGKSYKWDFGDGLTSTEASPVHDYSGFGIYSIKLNVKNNYTTSSSSQFIKVEDPKYKVTACFEYEVDPEDPFKVSFYNCSTNALFYFWKFSDGITSNEENPIHTFQHAAGETTINGWATLEASNNNNSNQTEKCIPNECVAVGKPNIYLYPEENLQLQVKINFPQGGQIDESVPEYSSGWDVFVDTTGRIDRRYDYLFYESTQLNSFQDAQGWCVPQDGLDHFFRQNLTLYGFNEREITDFVKYWVPRLNYSSYYNIYPQTNKIIDEVIQLQFSTQPNNILRLFYGIVATDSFLQLPKPIIPAFDRQGFVVTEWGVFIN